jgi:hypothetical protein
MDPITQQVVLATAGAAAAGEATYVDDVFSTFLYDGTGSTQSISNGIDLSGEGGMVWVKCRSDAADHRLIDTERGANNILTPNTASANFNNSTIFSSFNSDGFSVATDAATNGSGRDYASWSFRKAPGFFDVVTYSGNGSTQTISHNLGSVPGCIIVKCTNISRDWAVYHRSKGNSSALKLNDNSASRSFNGWGNTTPTATEFYLGVDSDVNNSAGTYVAYLFAHDDQSFGTNSDEAIIKCGSYTGSGSSETTVDLGFEPQWVMIKRTTNGTVDWVVYDNMRGVPIGTGDKQLVPNTTAAETDENRISFYSQGFKLQNDAAPTNSSGITYIYMAIRRPHKPPTAATEVFNAVQTTSQPFSVGFPTDLNINSQTVSAGPKYWVPRLTNGYMNSTATSGESAGSTYFKFDLQDSFSTGTFWGSSQSINWQFRRAPGFFDVVVYTGTGSIRTVDHNLGAVPELIIVKNRDRNSSWFVQDGINGATNYLQTNNANGTLQSSAIWNDTEPTSSVFTVYGNGVNYSGDTFMAYLFASLDGISKVGSYSGTGSNINVDCGFTAGARFVLIKQSEPAGTGSSGDWYVWDSTRGIVSGNDPYLLLNTTAAQTTNTDYIDPLNAGFTVTSSAPAGLNASGGTYIFLAIA